MQIVNRFIFGILATFVTGFVQATAVYSIDPVKSYVSSYVPVWTAYDATPLYMTGPDAPPPPAPTVTWALSWTLENFPLSGSFLGETVVSPDNPAWAHLTLTNQNLQAQLPSYITQDFVLPGQLTYLVSVGEIFLIGACSGDPFYPSPQWASCFTNGPPGYLTGTYDGKTLNMLSGSGGYPPIGFDSIFNDPTRLISDPGPPPSLDPNQYPSGWAGYQIVANAVPEPGTLFLILIGGLVLMLRSAFRFLEGIK